MSMINLITIITLSKLLEHVIKMVERIVEAKQRWYCITRFNILMRQLQEKYLDKREKLYVSFVDLEKAVDKIPQVVVPCKGCE